MKAERTTHNEWFRRKSAFGLHVVAALTFAGLMILIGMIPTDSAQTAVIYQSYGSLAVVQVTEYLFNPHLGILPLFQLPARARIVLFAVMAFFYALTFTFPLYFFFRSRRYCLLVGEIFALTLHALFARFVVAPDWIHQ